MTAVGRVEPVVPVRAAVYATAALGIVGVIVLGPAFEAVTVLTVATAAILVLLLAGSGATVIPVWLGLFLPTASLVTIVTWYGIETASQSVAAGTLLALVLGAVYLIHRVERVSMGAVSGP